MNAQLAKVFIAYANEDHIRASELCAKIAGAGFEPWMDRDRVLPGELWAPRIRAALREADFFLALLSPNSGNKRGFLQREISDALDLWQEKLPDDIYLIPVLLGACELPERLRCFQYVQVYLPDGWDKLVEALRAGVERLCSPARIALRLRS